MKKTTLGMARRQRRRQRERTGGDEGSTTGTKDQLQLRRIDYSYEGSAAGERLGTCAVFNPMKQKDSFTDQLKGTGWRILEMNKYSWGGLKFGDLKFF